MSWIEFIAVLGVAFISYPVVEVMRSFFARKRQEAETSNIFVDAGSRSVESMEKVINRLDKEVERLEGKVRELTTKVHELTEELEQQKQRPCADCPVSG